MYNVIYNLRNADCEWSY